MKSSTEPLECLARHYFVISVIVFIAAKGLLCDETGFPVSVIADYRNLKSWSFPIRKHSWGLYLMQTIDFSISQSVDMY